MRKQFIGLLLCAILLPLAAPVGATDTGADAAATAKAGDAVLDGSSVRLGATSADPANRTILVTYDYSLPQPHEGAHFRVVAPGGLVPLDPLPSEDVGAVRFATAPPTNASPGGAQKGPDAAFIPAKRLSTTRHGTFRLRAPGPGTYFLRADLATLAMDGTNESRVSTFGFDVDPSGRVTPLAAGDVKPSLPAQATVSDLGGASTEPPSAASMTVPLESTTSCTISFSVWYKLPSTMPFVGNEFAGKYLAGIQVDILSGTGAVLATSTTDASGRADFTVTTDPCNNNFKFRATTSHAKVLTTDQAKYVYTRTDPSTGTYAVQNAQAWTMTLPDELYSDGFWVHSRAVNAYLKVASVHDVDELVKVRFTSTVTVPTSECPDGGSCYQPTNFWETSEIWVDGQSATWDRSTIEHEYGHHVQMRLGGALPASAYGVHSGCQGDCHMWDSVHLSTGSAFKEAWGDFYAAVVRNDVGANMVQFDEDNVDWKHPDHPDMPNVPSPLVKGPFREGAIAGALWDTYNATGRNLAPFIQVIDLNPYDVYAFRDLWQSSAQPNLATLDSSLKALGISPTGDVNTKSNVADSGSGTSLSPWRGLGGDLSRDPNISYVDKADVFALNAVSGDIIRAYVSPSAGGDVDVYLYDPSGNLVKSGTRGAGVGDTVEYSVASSGYGGPGQWRLEFQNFGNVQGTYVSDMTVGQRSWSQEAEAFPTHTTGAVQSYSLASGGQEYNVWSNGYVQTTTNTLPLGYAKLSVTARGDQAGGIWPIMRTYVDGNLVSEETVGSSSLHTFVNYVYLSGTTTHTVKVEFTNDGMSGTDDRNLRVDVVSLTPVDDAWGQEAENFATKTTGGLSTSGGPSGGKAWNVWSNGYVQDTGWTDWYGPHEISLRVAGSPAGGVWPHMRVSVGGTVVMDTDVVNSEYRTYSATTQSLSPGLYDVKVEFTNDATIGTEDRNLFVDRADLWDLPS